MCFRIGQDGFVKEGPVNSVVMVNESTKIVKTPPFLDILASCTCQRVMELAVDMGYSVVQDNIPVEEMYRADEVLLVGGDVHITCVSSLDGRRIGSGGPGYFWKTISEKISYECESGSYFDSRKIIE